MDFGPASDVLNTLEIVPLPADSVPYAAIVLVKAMDSNGGEGWYTRYTNGLSVIEAVGALRVAFKLAEQDALDCYVDEVGDD